MSEAFMSEAFMSEALESELNRVLQFAQIHYQAGRLVEAETLYLQVIQQHPQNIPALAWLAAIAEQTNRPAASIAYYRQILGLNPNLSEPHSNLGSLLAQQGQIAEAIAHHQQAVVLAPTDADAHYNLGVVLAQDGQLEAAAAHYRQAIQIQPDFANAHNNLGVVLGQLHQPQDAIAHYRQAVRHNPHHANAHNNLGVALAQDGQTEAAVEHYNQALAIDPMVPNAHDNLGTALKELGRLAAAIAHYQQAIALKPQQPSPHDNLGTALQAQGNLEPAIASYRRAIACDPSYANAYGNLASALKDQGKLHQAIVTCEQGLELQPQNSHIHNVYGGILAEQGDIAGAIAQFQQALQHQPNHADTHLNLGMMLLTAGDFQRGFGEYHWRWQTKQCPSLRYREALWDGSDLTGRVILLTAEQGFGDTIQFVRYAALVTQRGGQVVIACQKPLLRLLQTVPGVTRCVDRDRVDVETHVHAPLLDLPLLLGTRLETIPAAVPYLSPPGAAQMRLQDFPEAILKIGFVWATNPANSTSGSRSCELADFLGLLALPGVALYSLQKEGSAVDRVRLQTGDRCQDLSDQLQDFGDTAAAIAALDLIISVDTAVAHLAGALAKPVWTLLPFAADWRWLRDRLDTPWYPTMRLFRQQKAGDWAGVFEQVRQALEPEIEQRRAVDGSFLAARSAARPGLVVEVGAQEIIDGSSTAARSAAVTPETAIDLNRRATQTLRQGDLEAAVLLYRQAIELEPDDATAYSNLGIALKDLHQPEAAIPYFQQAIDLQPDRADIYNGYGCTLIDLGQVETAIEQFRRSLRLDPNHADAHLNLGLALLLLGQFQPGFAEYRWRWRNKSDHSLPYPEALWDGSDLNGKTILLTAEQGFGDTIQFVRYAAQVSQRGGRVVLACQKSLLRLLQTVPGVSQCIDREAESVQTHFHAPLLELPRIFATTPATIPAQVPYLSVPPSPQGAIPPSPHFKIGIAWLTSPTSATASQRSCSLSHFLGLLALPGVALYSLQKEGSAIDRAQLQQPDRVFDLDPQLQDFGDTAAAIVALDLIISVDTAVAHLAGALAKPVWTLLPFAADWRWLRDRLDTPWYPTMRLFRQQKAGDWAGVFAQVRGALEQQARSTTPQLPCLADGLRQLKPGRHGVFLCGEGEVGRSLALHGEWRQGSLNLLQHLVHPGETIVEVGANVGGHTLFFAQAVGPTGTVLAIEPERQAFQTLCANLALNGLTNVHALPLDLSGAIESASSRFPGLPPLSIDELVLPDCRLMVVHGAALAVLQGANLTLQRCQPIVYLETSAVELNPQQSNPQESSPQQSSPHQSSPQQLNAAIQLLKSLGYTLYWHPVSWYGPDNFDRTPHPAWGSLTTTYLFGLPGHFGLTVNGLQPVA